MSPIRRRALAFGIVALILGGTAAAGTFLALSEYGIRFLPMSSVPSNCTSPDRPCAYVKSSDNNLYFHTTGGLDFNVSSGAVSLFALTDGATINTDASKGSTFSVTLAGNRTLANPTNLVTGAEYVWLIKQDATGGRTLSFGGLFTWLSGGSAPTLTSAANAMDAVSCVYDGTNLDCVFSASSGGGGGGGGVSSVGLAMPNRFTVSGSPVTTTGTLTATTNGVSKTANYTLTSTDYYVEVDTVTAAAATTMTLPSAPSDRREYCIKDSTGAAPQYHVTITGSQKIDAATSLILTEPYAHVCVEYSSAQSKWEIHSRSSPLWFGNTAQFVQNNTPVSGAGNDTVGMIWNSTQDMVCYGVIHYWAGPAATLTGSLWDGTPTLHASGSISVSGAGYFWIPFSTAYQVSSYTSYSTGVYDGGTNFTKSNTATVGATRQWQIAPGIFVQEAAFSAGNAAPATTNSAATYGAMPVCVPI